MNSEVFNIPLDETSATRLYPSNLLKVKSDFNVLVGTFNKELRAFEQLQQLRFQTDSEILRMENRNEDDIYNKRKFRISLEEPYLSRKLELEEIVKTIEETFGELIPNPTAEKSEIESLLKTASDENQMLKNENKQLKEINDEKQKLMNNEQGEKMKKLRSPTCACGNCKVTVKSHTGNIYTDSVTVAAGVYAATRKKSNLTESQLLIWAQAAAVQTEDQIKAIYAFASCSRIVEYLQDFEEWQNAVDNILLEVDGQSKEQPTWSLWKGRF